MLLASLHWWWHKIIYRNTHAEKWSPRRVAWQLYTTAAAITTTTTITTTNLL